MGATRCASSTSYVSLRAADCLGGVFGAELDNEVFEVNACEEMGDDEEEVVLEADDDNEEVLGRRDPSTGLA